MNAVTPVGAPIALIVAGGTGGHLYPGIAAARAILKQPVAGSSSARWQAVFVVRRGDIGKGILGRDAFKVFEISGQGLPRRASWRGFLFPIKLLTGFVQAWALLRRERPAVVVGMGGYLSFPVLAAARALGIRTVIHEQNVLPGLANRLLGPRVDRVAVSFSESRPYFKNSQVEVTGLPVRSEIGGVNTPEGRKAFGLENEKMTFLVFGGSQGAHRLNVLLADTWKILAVLPAPFQVLHVTGERDHREVQNVYRSIPVKAVVLAYCHEMAAAYAAADLVICRAGASTVAELLVARRPAVFIPFPFASDNHQLYNAQVMQKRGLADIVLEEGLTASALADHLRPYLENSARLASLRKGFENAEKSAFLPPAAEKLARYITLGN